VACVSDRRPRTASSLETGERAISEENQSGYLKRNTNYAKTDYKKQALSPLKAAILVAEMAIEDQIRLPPLNLIHRRQRLLKKLTRLVKTDHCRLIIVDAPGGYGKSILLADFAQTIDLPVCWCSLEPADRDPTSFLALLAHSITDRFREIEREGLTRLVEQGDNQASINRIAVLLGGVGPHLLILDDYHKAWSVHTNPVLSALLKQLPQTSTLIVAFSERPAGELLLKGAASLTRRALRFTATEVQAVMRKRFGYRIDPADAAELARTTGGNIARIILAGHLREAGRPWGQLAGDREMIYDYLAREALGRQPAQMQRFLLRTSVLPDMTPELCNELLEITDAQACLEELARRDLFVTQAGAGFRYHDLFAQFLRDRLAGEDGQLYRQICIKAGRLLAARSRFEEAITLYLAVQAWDEAVTLLEAEGNVFFGAGRTSSLRHWLAQIPEPDLKRRPRLLLLQGQSVNLERPETALGLYQRAEEQFTRQGDPLGAAEARLRQSDSLRLLGRARESLEVASGVLEQLAGIQAGERLVALALRNRGVAAWLVGHTADALADARRALALFEQLDDPYNIGVCHHNIGVALVNQGSVSQADRHFRAALKIWEALASDTDRANTLNSLGVSLHLVGRYDEALAHFERSLEIALEIGASRRAAYAQAGIGDAYLGRGRYERAAAAFEASTEFARQGGVRNLEIYNMVRLGECSYQQHDLAAALDLAGRAREIAAEIGLRQERGLACMLQAKIHVRQGEYAPAFELFREALSCIRNDLLEQARVRLWWAYSLFLDFRAASALEQLAFASKSVLAMGELRGGLKSTAVKARGLLLHFRYRADTPAEVRDSIELLLDESRPAAVETGLQVFAFGPTSLVSGGEYKNFADQRGKIQEIPEFLLYLILEGGSKGLRWNEISVVLWPDRELDDRSRDAFHKLLRRLKSILGRDHLVIEDNFYRIEPLEWCDALVFDTLYQRQSLAGSSEERLALQLELIDLYRGEFLEGFELKEWGASCRAGYENAFLRTVRLAGEALLAANESQLALDIIQKGLGQNYYREDLHRSAFRAYAQLGLRGDLKAHHQQLCRTFEQELGAPPEPRTRQLYDQLVSEG
jgi:ATP/maltotriose-dependent transcriptional regulator MalT/DNA-binding SARP family transcriptional activator